MTLRSRPMRVLSVIAGAVLLLAGANAAAQPYPYQDKSLSPEERAADLLSRLTLEEKATLCLHESEAVPRLGIRRYVWWNEALHGIARNGSATVFPQPIGMAASFDTELLETVFTAVSDEGRVKNLQADPDHVLIYEGVTYWTPNINIFRDPRWGRGMETYGEDPFLTGQLGMAVVRGLQGPDDSPIRKAHACAKHYAVHSGPESGRHRDDINPTERDLRETYLPAFKDLVTKANVQEVMTAYNRFRGDPCSASDYLVNKILRGEWGYKGMIVSDCGAVHDFFEKGHHEVVDNAEQAAAAAVHNGVDVECGSVYHRIPEAVRDGLLSMEDLDRNLMRILVQRFRLGEMDRESPWDGLSPDIVEGPDHRALSLKMAHETMVLLQNRDGILPLKGDEKIALVGPNADDVAMQWGNYNAIPKSTVTLLDALRERVPDLVNVRGCGIIDYKYRTKPSDSPLSKAIGMDEEQMKEFASKHNITFHDLREFVRSELSIQNLFVPEYDEAAVLKALEGIDVVIFAGGISPYIEGEEMPVKLPGFSGGDRTSLELPDVQRRCLQDLHKAGKKVILVNFSGSAIGLVPETESCDAILQAWYPGQDGGTAVADVLFGDVSPSGKLPVTFFRNVDQLPAFSNYDMEGHTYRYFRGEPLYPFGYGLSYTTFSYGKAKVSRKKIVVPVTNTGSVDADEVVQLYVKKSGDPKGPSKTLRGYKRVTVPAGKTVKVTIPFTEDTFQWWDPEKKDVVPVKGDFVLMYGPSSADSDLKRASYTVK